MSTLHGSQVACCDIFQSPRPSSCGAVRRTRAQYNSTMHFNEELASFLPRPFTFLHKNYTKEEMMHYVMLYIEHLQKHRGRLLNATETQGANETHGTHGELGVLTSADLCSEDDGYSTVHTEEFLLDLPSETSLAMLARGTENVHQHHLWQQQHGTIPSVLQVAVAENLYLPTQQHKKCSDDKSMGGTENKLLCKQLYSCTKEQTTLVLQVVQHQENNTNEISAVDVVCDVLGDDVIDCNGGNDGSEDSAKETSICEQQQEEGTIQRANKCSPDEENSETVQTCHAGLLEVNTVLIDLLNDSGIADSIITGFNSTYSPDLGRLNGQEEPSCDATQELESFSPSSEIFPEDSPWMPQYSTPPHTVLYSEVVTVESHSSACVSPAPAQSWLGLSPSLFNTPSKDIPNAIPALDQHGIFMNELDVRDSPQAQGDISWMVAKKTYVPPLLHERQGQEPNVTSAWYLQPNDVSSSQALPLTCESLPKPVPALPVDLHCTPSYIKQEEAEYQLGSSSSDELGMDFMDDCKDQTWTPSICKMRRGAGQRFRRSVINSNDSSIVQVGGSRHQRVGVLQHKRKMPADSKKRVGQRKQCSSSYPKESHYSKNHPIAAVQRRKKCINGFIMFCRLERRNCICQHPDMSSTQTTCELARVWRGMSSEEKRIYREKAYDFSRQDNRVLKAEDGATLNKPFKVKTESVTTPDIFQVLAVQMKTNEPADSAGGHDFSMKRVRCKQRLQRGVFHPDLHKCPASCSSQAPVPLISQQTLHRRSQGAVTRKTSRVQRAMGKENPQFVVELPEPREEQQHRQQKTYQPPGNLQPKQKRQKPNPGQQVIKLHRKRKRMAATIPSADQPDPGLSDVATCSSTVLSTQVLTTSTQGAQTLNGPISNAQTLAGLTSYTRSNRPLVIPMQDLPALDSSIQSTPMRDSSTQDSPTLVVPSQNIPNAAVPCTTVPFTTNLGSTSPDIASCSPSMQRHVRGKPSLLPWLTKYWASQRKPLGNEI